MTAECITRGDPDRASTDLKVTKMKNVSVSGEGALLCTSFTKCLMWQSDKNIYDYYAGGRRKIYTAIRHTCKLIPSVASYHLYITVTIFRLLKLHIIASFQYHLDITVTIFRLFKLHIVTSFRYHLYITSNSIY